MTNSGSILSLYQKWSMCQWFWELNTCSQRISRDSRSQPQQTQVVVQTDPIVERTRTIQEWPLPKTVKDTKELFVYVHSLFELSEPKHYLHDDEEKELNFCKAIIFKLKSYRDLWQLHFSSEEDSDSVLILFEGKIKELEEKVEVYYAEHEKKKKEENKIVMYGCAVMVVLFVIFFVL